MMLPKGTYVAVADGEKLNLFRNSGDEVALELTPVAHDAESRDNQRSRSRQTSSSNPAGSQANEDNFVASMVDYLNKEVLDGRIGGLVVIAAPRALGEMRKHYHKVLMEKLVGEIAKDLTGHPVEDVAHAIREAQFS